jgi:two-component system alkaline phosphatase synthesis response regulator PhoP
MADKEIPVSRSAPLDVLIVDDERYTCEIMQVLIEDLGHRVHIAGTGLEALDWLQDHHADVVMMDVLMPGIDGLETVRRLRDQVDTRDLPIVCVSAKTDGTVRGDGLAAGCDRYLTKPVHEDKIFKALTEALVVRGRLAPGDTFD